MLRFYNGRVLTMTDGCAISADEVWVDGGKIAYVGPARADMPAFERQIDLDGDLLKLYNVYQEWPQIPELTDRDEKELEMMQILIDNYDKVETLANLLLEREVIFTEYVQNILGDRPFKTEEVVETPAPEAKPADEPENPTNTENHEPDRE